jgi:nitroreductase
MSVRAFRPDVPPTALVRELLKTAAHAPSGGNLQPWRIYALAGQRLNDLKAAAAANPNGETPEYDIYPPNLWEPYRTRRFRNSEALYATIGIVRDDKTGRLRQLARNGELFGAPVGLFFCLDRKLGPPQWADLGIYMQTLMLLALELGLDTCPQEFWSRYPKTLATVLDLPEEYMVFSGMALGWRDPDHPINAFRSARAPFEEWGAMIGFDPVT